MKYHTNCYNDYVKQKMMGKNNQSFQELVRAARKALSEGDEAEARLHAETLVSHFPKSEEGWLVMASLSKPQEALTHLENALRANPNSQATRQGIRLVTSQILNEKQESHQTLELTKLEDTQPVSINIFTGTMGNSKVDLNENNKPDNIEPEQALFQPEDVPVHIIEKETDKSDEVPIKGELLQELPADGEILEQIPEVLPDSKNNTDILAQKIGMVEQESLTDSEKPFSKKRIRITRKHGQASVHPNIDLKSNPEIITGNKRNSRRKNLNTDVIELLIIAGAAVLLPALVFLFFFLRK